MKGVDEVATIDYRFTSRTPMQWDDTENAGFSSSPKPWLPVESDYAENNVMLQSSQKISHLTVFKQLIELRQNPTFKYGSLIFGALRDENVLVYKRELEAPHTDVYVVVLNLSNELLNLNLKASIRDLPSMLRVVVCSVQSNKDLG